MSAREFATNVTIILAVMVSGPCRVILGSAVAAVCEAERAGV